MSEKSYKWRNNPAVIAKFVHDRDVPKGAEVTFEVTTPGGGCTYTASVTIDVLSDRPPMSLSTNAAGDTICRGDAIAITASPAGLANYEFQINGVTRQNGAGRVFNTTLITGTSTITIIATKKNN